VKEPKDNPRRLLSIEDAILDLRRPMIIYAILAVSINVLVLGVGIQIHFKEKSNQTYTSFETCLYGMNSIINNNPDLELVHKNIIKDLKSVKFNVDRVHLIKAIDNFSCDVFVKGGKGVRRYLVALEKNSKFKHLYRILDIKGKKVNSRYQL
jgi:hypothetical protein